MIDYDATGIEIPLLPDGYYDLSIVGVDERTSKNGNPMVNVRCQVINNLEFNGRTLFHNVTFLPKDNPGAGMAIHFLKTIGMPFEGQLRIDPAEWTGCAFRAKIGVREYEGKKRNEIKLVAPSLALGNLPPLPQNQKVEDVPF